ncbi:MAG TPA: glycosyltransferase family 9 protein [Casimicrobiaceae bacterium]|nr:glycosyltransferase family 9 protein [Casimicrobiaceae bacterium]
MARATRSRRAPANPRRILVAHHLLLGDTLMLAPLFAKLRAQYPAAEIVTTVAPAIAALFAARPYGVRALGWDPRARNELLFEEGPYDLALVPGDNRFAWLAAAMHARWIVAFAGDRPRTKNLPVDALVPYSNAPKAWGDMVAELVPGPAPRPYRAGDWPAPAAAPFERPRAPFALLHVGASSPLKQWLPERWRALAQAVHARGLEPVFSAGRGEEAGIDAIDPQRRHLRYAGTLDLAQLWHLVADARLLVCPDTGVAHLGRLAATPTVTLFGPGSAVICGAGDYWRDMPYRAVTVAPFPCRDQHILFRREIAWVQRCGRTTAQCTTPRCMHAIEIDSVLNAVDELMR